jgi:subtilase family serine protease
VTALTPPARGGLGQLIAVKNTVTNTGLAPAGAFSVRFHLASDATLDASVAVLGVRALGGLAAGATSAVTTSLRLPGNVSAGQYYVIAVVDALGQQPELDETNDVTVSLPFTVEPYRPELAITALAPPPGGIAGQLIAIPNTVRNTGLAPAGPFSVRVHLASDATLDSSVAVLGTRAVSGLAAGSASAATTALRLPGNIPAGQYYVVAVVDALGQQPELDETNNITVAGPLAITSPPPH